MSTILDTERLIIRKLTIADADFVVQLLNTPTWLRFIGDRGVRTIADAQSYIMKGPLMSYAVHGFGLYLLELKENGLPIGMCGILKRDTLDMPDLGYALLPDHEGKGYGSEAASAITEHAFTELGLSSIAAITDPENERSVRLLKKLGFVFSQMIRPDDKELMLLIRDARTYK